MNCLIYVRKVLFILGISVFVIAPTVLYASETNGTIDNTNHYAWSENLGWIDFGTTEGAVTISDTEMTGYAYNETAGWISLNCSNTDTCDDVSYKIENDGDGNLSGYAWTENLGWVIFSCETTNICATSDFGVTIDENGEFHGEAWIETSGWILFHCEETNSCDDVSYKVSTDWRPQSARTTSDTGEDTSSDQSQGSSGGGGVKQLYQGTVIVDINNHAEKTPYPEVILQLDGGPRAFWMMLSDDPSFLTSQREPYQKARNWRLCPYRACTDGVYTVYVRFYDRDGSLISSITHDSIILESVQQREPLLVTPPDGQIEQDIFEEYAPNESFPIDETRIIGRRDVIPSSSLDAVIPPAPSFVEADSELFSQAPPAFMRFVDEVSKFDQSITFGENKIFPEKKFLPKTPIDFYIYTGNAEYTVKARVVQKEKLPSKVIPKKHFLRRLFGLIPFVNAQTDDSIIFSEEDILFTDEDKDNIYHIRLDVPEEGGAYRVETEIVDNEGNIVRTQNIDFQVPEKGHIVNISGENIKEAKISLYQKNPKTNNFEFWSGNQFQKNPYYGDDAGTYIFFVEPGEYMMHVEASHYVDYVNDRIFIRDESAFINMDLTLTHEIDWFIKENFWYLLAAFTSLVGALISVIFVYKAKKYMKMIDK